VEDGLRDEILTQALDEELRRIGIDRARLAELEPGEGSVRVAEHLAEVARRLVEPVEEHEALLAQVANVNALLDALQLGRPSTAHHILTPPRKLTGIFPPRVGLATPTLPDHPVIPLGEAELLSNAAGQPNLGQLVRQECRSADRVDLLCAFIGPTGVHTLLDDLEGVVRRGRARGIEAPLRVITSTWLGATKRRALDMLCELGAHVYIVFDGGRLRLHAKSWRFERSGGLGTAYVGSSNMSQSALEQGLEWNVRLSERTNPGVIRRIEQTFEAYLADPLFERYLPERDHQRLEAALAAASRRGAPHRIVETTSPVDSVRPRPFDFQKRILEELSAARQRHDRHRNLVVAATGTGKTVIAAFDYDRLARQQGGPLPSLLFVAHREEILAQSRTVFRRVLGQPEFGEILAGGRRPPTGVHVFANIQSLGVERLAALAPDAYDVVIIDEFHHSAAPSYRELLLRLRPRELIGLTATPERADGEDVTAFFDGHITSELRLWEAIEQGLLAPFHYFGVDDGSTDLAAVRWSRGRYDAAALGDVLTGDTRRVDTLVTALNRYVPSLGEMRALGFCVSVAHAEFMAESFSRRGIPSACLHGGIAPADRRVVLDRLESATDPLRCVFSVDVLGEGVDVPEVDTLLLLRPTESATVFLQQLGRGLRLSPRKQVLTVVDMVSIPHERFRFDRALGSVLDPAGGSVRTQAELGFPFLPSGCEIHFEREAHARVLANLRKQLGKQRWNGLVAELKAAGPTTSLAAFLERTERPLEHVYSGTGRSWGRLRVDAGFQAAPAVESDRASTRLHSLLHIDDEERTALYRSWLDRDAPPRWDELPTRQQRLLDMLLVGLWNTPGQRPARDEALAILFRDRELRSELATLLDLLAQRAERITLDVEPGGTNPSRVHARYTKEEGLIAFGKSSYTQAPPLQQGVYRAEGERSDFFFVTLRKDEKTFSPSTRYHDYALGASRFHWETQHATRAEDATANRYITHDARGDHIALFVRETAKTPLGGGAPFTFLGRCHYRSHAGSAPVQIVWDLEHDMPTDLLEVARLIG
jgi:superfamily II DNA or RNA helicase/HKD family nuclease